MISKLFDNPTFTKFFSLFVAVLIWLFVGAQNPETETVYRGVENKVVTQNAQAENGVSVVEMSSSTVDVTLKGSKNVLGRITAADIYATIEVDASVAPGYYNFPVQLTLPVDGVTITGKNPAGVDVWLDRTSSVTVPVELSCTSRLDEEIYVVEQPMVSTESIEVYGPASELSNIKLARVDVSITDQNMGEAMLSLPFTLVDENGVAVDSENLETSVRAVTVTPQVFERRSLPVTVSFLNRPEGWMSDDFSYTVSPQTLELLVPVRQTTSTTEYEAGVIDLSQHAQSGTVTLPVSTEYLAEGQPDEITVSLNFGQLETTTAELESLGFDNRPSGITVEVLTVMPLTVNLRGTPEAIERYTAENLRGIVDLSGLKSGETAELPVRIITGDSEIGVLGSLRVALRASEAPAEE